MDWLSGITAFDVLVLIIFIGFLARGIWVGFITQISSLVAMIGGFILAGYFDNDFYRLLLPYIDNSQVAFFITYILLFVAFFYLIKLAGFGLKKVMDVTLTTWFDRTVGGLFGFIKGIFFVSLLFVFLGSFMSGSNNYLKKSVSYPALSYSSDIILAFVRDHDLRSYFKPKEPAIKLLPFKKSSDSGGLEKDIVPEPGEPVVDSQEQDPERRIYL